MTAVGGTELVKDPTTARGWSESVWGSALPGVLPNIAQGTGSGCSTWEPKPAWQHDAGCANRTVADVSAVADNVAIYDSSPEIGGWGVVAGTSIATPVIASVYALAGNAKTVDYGSYPYSHTSGLFDVTHGVEHDADHDVRLPLPGRPRLRRADRARHAERDLGLLSPGKKPRGPAAARPPRRYVSRSRTTTGISRIPSVFFSYSAKPGQSVFCFSQIVSRSAPSATRAWAE